MPGRSNRIGRQSNEALSKCLKIANPGDSDYAEGTIVTKEDFEQTNAEIETLGGTPAKGKKPKSATASTQLLGITKAAVQSNSFISAASFQETTKVLTEAALAGKVDRLVGLKENVILGHLIPAGTGFRIFQESEVNYRREALEELANAPVSALEESFPLLNAEGASQDTVPLESAPSFDALVSEVPAAEAPIAETPTVDPEGPPASASEGSEAMHGGGQD